MDKCLRCKEALDHNHRRVLYYVNGKSVMGARCLKCERESWESMWRDPESVTSVFETV